MPANGTGTPARARTRYPYTIDNGAGEKLTFMGVVPGTEAYRLEAENVVSPGAGPPMHVHYHQEEGFTVVRGRLGYQRVGEPPAHAEAGESIVFAPGEAHRFWNAGDGELCCVGYMEPPGNAEYFLTQLFASQRENGGTRPSLLDAAYLLRRYRGEFGMLAIPAIVQRVLFPMLFIAGRITGRHTRFADAPDPMTPVVE